ncbi:MAG TPA: hypothetical protein VGI34_02420, partial [Candidatus Acidoferrales bacterium]
FEIIVGELTAFSEKLANKPMIVVATKLDATTDRTRLEKLREFCAERGLEFHAISSATGEGVKQLVRAMADALDRLAPAEAASPEESEEADIDIIDTEGEPGETNLQASAQSSSQALDDSAAAAPAAPRTEKR